MFVFNTMQGDLRVERQARTLVRQGYQVRVYCFLEPGLPEQEERSGFTIVRLDQRPALTRWFDDKVMRRWKRVKQSVPQFSAAPLVLPPDREARKPCPRPLPRSYTPGGSPARRHYRDYVSQINQRWAQAAVSWRPDYSQAHDVDALEAAFLVAQRCDSRLIYDAHEIWVEQPFIHEEEDARYWLDCERRWIGRADAVLTVNQPIASWMEERYGKKVVPLYNCQQLQPPPRPAEKLSERVGGRPVALYQGVIGLDRGLEELLASAQLQSQVVLAFRGQGERLEALHQLAQQHNIEVLFLPAVPSHEVVASAAQADIGLIPFLPSCLNHYWSTPNKLFEYMMAGLPMAASDLPELQAFVADLQIGRLFDPYSPGDIARCLASLADPVLRNQMGSRARQLAEETYCWERESQKLVNIYQELGERRKIPGDVG